MSIGMVCWRLVLPVGVLWSILLTGTQAQEMDAQPGPLSARGVIRAINRLEVRSDLGVPVAQVPFRKGMAFKKGDTLLAFDCARLAAERNAASATATSAAIELRQKQKLLKHGAAGKGEVEIAGAAAAKSGAERTVIDARMAGCDIKAPFDGIVADAKVHVQELPVGTEPLLIAVDTSNLEVELVMPSSWLAKIKPGSIFDMAIDETGESLSGTVTRFGAEVDAVSQTIEVIGTLDASNATVRPGMSGSVSLEGIRKGGT